MPPPHPSTLRSQPCTSTFHVPRLHLSETVTESRAARRFSLGVSRRLRRSFVSEYLYVVGKCQRCRLPRVGGKLKWHVHSVTPNSRHPISVNATGRTCQVARTASAFSACVGPRRPARQALGLEPLRPSRHPSAFSAGMHLWVSNAFGFLGRHL